MTEDEASSPSHEQEEEFDLTTSFMWPMAENVFSATSVQQKIGEKRELMVTWRKIIEDIVPSEFIAGLMTEFSVLVPPEYSAFSEGGIEAVNLFKHAILEVMDELLLEETSLKTIYDKVKMHYDAFSKRHPKSPNPPASPRKRPPSVPDPTPAPWDPYLSLVMSILEPLAVGFLEGLKDKHSESEILILRSKIMDIESEFAIKTHRFLSAWIPTEQLPSLEQVTLCADLVREMSIEVIDELLSEHISVRKLWRKCHAYYNRYKILTSDRNLPPR